MKNLSKKLNQIQTKEITKEMKESYLDYAMSVIVSRALPDVRDGLKPVQRRILYAMYRMGLVHTAKFRKSATVVGDCLGKFHPHGDTAVYDAAMRMAQDFSLRYPLIQGQGNVGSVDDPSEFAAMRYTEMKLSKIGEETLKDIDKNTVDFRDNYDGTRKEPVVLPSPLPQLLLNGTLGIAVGMATSIPPHNLSELLDCLIYLISHPKAETQDLFQPRTRAKLGAGPVQNRSEASGSGFIKGPDFPTGGETFDQKAIIEAYSQGRGPILTRGKTEIIESRKDHFQILITEIPFQVQKSTLLEQIANLIQEKRIEGIKDVRDESDKEGMRIVIDLRPDSLPQKILNQLYKFTDLQKTFHLNMLALVDGIQPKVLSLVEVLNYFLLHREEVVVKRTKYELIKTKERNHILEGLAKCLGKIDEVIKIIKGSSNREEAQKSLQKKFKLTQIQANAILETRLASLAKLEIKKIKDELKETRLMIEELNKILKSPQKIKKLMEKEFKELQKTFGDERRTKVHSQKIGELSERDLIPEAETIIILTKAGYIKRITPKTYKSQHRGGKGVLGMKTINQDIVEYFLVANTHDNLFFFTDSGKVFRTLCYEIPEEKRVSRGRGVLNFLEISQLEKILSILPFGKNDTALGIKYLVMVTKNGIIKKTEISEFENIRKSGLIAFSLKKGDTLRAVQKTTGQDEIVLVTKKGMSIRFKEKQIRPMGRQAAGVKAIRLRQDDEVIGMNVITANSKEQIANGKKQTQCLLVVMENGYGKRTKLSQYRLQTRGGTGIKTAKITQKTGQIVFLRVLEEEEDLVIVSQKGQVIRTKISSIPIVGRITQGVKIMKLDKDDKIASAICI